MWSRPVGRIPEKTRSLARTGVEVSTGDDTAGSIALGTDAACHAACFTLVAVEVEEAIRSRRTVKAFAPEPVERETLEELLELARWAPNHNLTNPWRFRVIGPRSLARLKRAAADIAAAEAPPDADRSKVEEAAAAKLDRAPTLVVCSARRSDDPVQDDEDQRAASCAAYIVLLAAHARGLAGYWRTPAVLRSPAGREAVGIPEDEHFIGLLHLGWARQAADAPERDDPGVYVRFLD
jgi:nitroreductase